MTLGDAAVGSTVIVAKIDGDGAYKRRIMDMGITKGSEIFIRKVAPLGDPVEITVRGYELSVRKNDAQCVLVKVVDTSDPFFSFFFEFLFFLVDLLFGFFLNRS